jgi:hypothetical protein
MRFVRRARIPVSDSCLDIQIVQRPAPERSRVWLRRAIFLFAEKGPLSAPDFFEYQWTDAAGERHRLLD